MTLKQSILNYLDGITTFLSDEGMTIVFRLDDEVLWTAHMTGDLISNQTVGDNFHQSNAHFSTRDTFVEALDKLKLKNTKFKNRHGGCE